ncbi:T-complex protein 1 subunit theta, partial [Fragariocoptes setiger]
MALPVPRAPGFQSMMKEGARYFSGIDEAVLRNIEACSELCQTLRSAYGPKGLNKMIVNHLGNLFVTSDAGTIMHELQIEHPAAKILFMAAQMQEQEIGDGTNFVMQIAGSLLDKSAELIRMGIKPTEIIDGYELAVDKVLDQYLTELVVKDVKDIRSLDQVLPVLKTVIMTKQYGNEDFLARLVADACISVLPPSQASGDLPNKSLSFNVDNVRVCKIVGGGTTNSHVVRGMVFLKHMEGNYVQPSIKDAKIAVYSCPVDSAATETKGTVLIKSANELMNFSRGEEELLESQIKAIAESGVNVIVSGAKFGELALHYCDKYKLTALRLMSKFDLKRVCRTVDATALLKLKAPTAEEVGHCSGIEIDEIGDMPVVVFKQTSTKSKVATIVIRGATTNVMDDVERALNDGINTFKLLTRDGRLVAGAGACELEIARKVQQFARTLPGMEQYAVGKFGESIKVLAGIIAENSGLKASEALAIASAAHQAGEANAAIDITQDSVKTFEATQKQIYDTWASKYWGLKFATKAACTILQVDRIICAKPAQGPKPPPSKGAAWDNDE